MKKIQLFIMLGGATAALLLYRRQRKKKEGMNEDFKRGWATGWVTPGPSTVLLLTGVGYYATR